MVMVINLIKRLSNYTQLDWTNEFNSVLLQKDSAIVLKQLLNMLP